MLHAFTRPFLPLASPCRGCSARLVLAEGCAEPATEWKIFLEAVLLEYRSGNLTDAIARCESALRVYPGTGRLWAMLIQLYLDQGFLAQRRMFHRALYQVPKSGEVWCEGARLCMNPLSPAYDLELAAQYLEFAIEVGLASGVPTGTLVLLRR